MKDEKLTPVNEVAICLLNIV